MGSCRSLVISGKFIRATTWLLILPFLTKSLPGRFFFKKKQIINISLFAKSISLLELLKSLFLMFLKSSLHFEFYATYAKIKNLLIQLTPSVAATATPSATAIRPKSRTLLSLIIIIIVRPVLLTVGEDESLRCKSPGGFAFVLLIATNPGLAGVLEVFVAVGISLPRGLSTTMYVKWP